MNELIDQTLQRQDRQLLIAVLIALLFGAAGVALTPLLGIAAVIGVGIAILMFVSPYMALLLFLILLYTRPADYYPVLQKLMLVKLTAIICLAAWFITSLIIQRRKFIATAESKWLFAFLGSIFLSFLSSENIGFSFGIFFEKFFKIIVLYILITNLVDSRKKVEVLIWVMIGLAIFNAYLGINNYFSGTRVVGDLGRTQLVGILGDPNDLALSLVIMMPMMLGIAHKSKSWGIKIFLYIAFAELTWSNLLTMSRGGLMGQIAAMGAMFMVGKSNVVKIVALGLAMLLILGVATNAIGLRGEDEGAEESGDSRFWLWAGGLRMVKASPIWGQGFANYTLKIAHYSDMPVANKTAHSIWFLVIGELGLVGITTFVGFITWSMIKGRKLLQVAMITRERSDFCGVMKTLHASLVGFLVCGSFLSQSYEWFLYIISAIIVATYQNLTPEERALVAA